MQMTNNDYMGIKINPIILVLKIMQMGNCNQLINNYIKY